jgi:hypothetical protein
VSVHRFEAVLGGETGGLPGVVLPAEVAAAMGGRARIPVAGTIAGVAFRGSTMPMGDGRHCVGFRNEIRAQAGVSDGDTVTIEIARDDAPRTVEVPADLAAALAADPAVQAAFDAMSYTHRREWAAAVAKRPETRERRVAQAVAAARERMR